MNRKIKIIIRSIFAGVLLATGITSVSLTKNVKANGASAATQQTITEIKGFKRDAGNNSKSYITIAGSEVVGDYGVSYSGNVYAANGTALPLVLKNVGGASGDWTNGGTRAFQFRTDDTAFIDAIGSGTTFYITKDSVFSDGTKEISFGKEYVFTSIYDGNCKYAEYVPTVVTFDIKEVQNRLSATQYRVGVNEFSGLAAGFSQVWSADVIDNTGKTINVNVKDAGTGSSSKGNRLVYLNLSVEAHGHILIIPDGTRFVTSDLTKVLVMKNGYRLNASTSSAYQVDAVGSAEDFANVALNALTCDASGASAPTFASGYSWNVLKEVAMALDAESKAELKAYAESTNEAVKSFMAKYNYIVGKYGTNAYADFLGLGGYPASSSRHTLSVENSSSSFVALISILSVLSLTGFVVFKKKYSK